MESYWEIKVPALEPGGKVQSPALESGGEVKNPALESGGKIKNPAFGIQWWGNLESGFWSPAGKLGIRLWNPAGKLGIWILESCGKIGIPALESGLRIPPTVAPRADGGTQQQRSPYARLESNLRIRGIRSLDSNLRPITGFPLKTRDGRN